MDIALHEWRIAGVEAVNLAGLDHNANAVAHERIVSGVVRE